MYLHFLFLFLLLNFGYTSTVSVVIPCHKKHIKYLPRLLESYAKQTKIPDEVIISISENDKRIPFFDKLIENKTHPFLLKILYNKERIIAGPNRNLGCSLAKSDIILLQDADDTPHPQRVEIVSSIFDSSGYDLLIHEWVDFEKMTKENIINYYSTKNLNEIRTRQISSIEEIYSLGCFHFGNIAVKNNLVKIIAWPCIYPGEDQAFVRSALEANKNVGVIFLPLINYRIQLSAGN